jgi:hypothetical protein
MKKSFDLLGILSSARSGSQIPPGGIIMILPYHLLKEKYRHDDEVQAIMRGLEKEMDIHRKYLKEYGYLFFVLKNRNPHQ